MKKILVLAGILGITTVSSSLFSAPAKAVVADVPINVDVPEIVYLQTYESITYQLDAADLSDAFSAANNPEKVAAVTVKKDGTIDAGDPLTAPEFTTPNAKVTTADFLAYQVWGIGGATGKLKAVVDYDGTELKNGTSTVGIKLTSPTADVEADAKGLDPATPTIKGNVSFEFDLKGATKAGLHSPTGTEALKITATAI
ncbi:hypothetical protein LC653_03360 [Nostoc sp. CHAB 5784]|uniref:hypothetical protein n=1 Tax=Nostoc mirabile TaxID=2907820 RepID=UPI001E4244C4|nr:hypothetical protein [Nostoc mirabile]MCC5662997.1 hypothetical protein [Nostoc mirabile CHAB5784]